MIIAALIVILFLNSVIASFQYTLNLLLRILTAKAATTLLWFCLGNSNLLENVVLGKQ